jgi:hypothetical protein
VYTITDNAVRADLTESGRTEVIAGLSDATPVMTNATMRRHQARWFGR